ncbi:MAG TPA: YegS/Rv2252/BmrU family lipid kinase [Sandaracinaceae bacterium LLY-WYZ-13_1]|nr:YegS/Rv2252/BmrU family lipid kinase [Sandaracinaceae bacterium LLY-WYZ-13_1]
MDEPFRLIVNPHAGAGAAARRLPALERALKRAEARYEVAPTRGPGDATRLVREALEAGVAGVAVVGGDGTLSEAVNGFFDASGAPIAPDAWLGPLPCGTGGDFRRTVGMSKRIEPMVTRMLWARPRRIDAGWLEYVDDAGEPARRAFLNIASFGLGGKVDRVVNESPKWMGGTPAFLLGTLRAMVGYRNQRVRLRLDDGPPREAAILNVAIANGRYFGGGMQIAPRAELDDGLFDVVSLEMGPREALTSTTAVYLGAHLDRDDVRFERAARVHAEPVDPTERVLLDVDGEAPGALPATFALRPGALRLRG